MKYRQLGGTDLNVSVICLGTMTWGEQNTEAEAHRQLDMALDYGVNFIDAAEMYPVPADARTQGRTESYIGSWLSARKNRDKVILATKVAGPSGMTWIRPDLRFDEKNIRQAVEDSLRRLQTDCIDLYQLHWPERETNMFGDLDYRHNFDEAPWTSFEETLEALDEQVKAGKIRHVGLSNETPWGTMKFLQTAEAKGLPRMQSIQNAYNLVNRAFEVGLSEIAIRERSGLLAYSPLGCGVLSGKYLDGNAPPGARLTRWPNYFVRYRSLECVEAVRRYVQLAKDSGLDPAQMALAFVNSRPFVTSNIIGATTLEQLKTNIESINITLPEHVLTAIDNIHHAIPNPAP